MLNEHFKMCRLPFIDFFRSIRSMIFAPGFLPETVVSLHLKVSERVAWLNTPLALPLSARRTTGQVGQVHRSMDGNTVISKWIRWCSPNSLQLGTVILMPNKMSTLYLHFLRMSVWLCNTMSVHVCRLPTNTMCQVNHDGRQLGHSGCLLCVIKDVQRTTF